MYSLSTAPPVAARFVRVLVLLCVLLPLAVFATKPNVIPGGVQQIADFANREDLQALAAFAVEQHNEKEGADLHLVRVESAQQQVVAGILFHLTLLATSPSSRRTAQYKATVWERAWQKFKALQAFAPVPDTDRAATPAELHAAGAAAAAETAAGTAAGMAGGDDSGAAAGGGGEGGCGNAARDGGEEAGVAAAAGQAQGTCSNRDGEAHSSPAVLEAAERAVAALQQRSNSLYPYRLKEVVAALATPAAAAGSEQGTTMFHLTLRLQREAPAQAQEGQQVVGALPDELYEVEVLHSPNGQWSLRKAVALQ
ncbi:unnamed protein product [Closterium sp. Naga37s-1]|nr:unnamed protein product [Closterium sp. Naga37s-1]